MNSKIQNFFQMKKINPLNSSIFLLEDKNDRIQKVVHIFSEDFFGQSTF